MVGVFPSSYRDRSHAVPAQRRSHDTPLTRDLTSDRPESESWLSRGPFESAARFKGLEKILLMGMTLVLTESISEGHAGVAQDR